MFTKQENDEKNTTLEQPVKKPLKTLLKEKIIKHWQLAIKVAELVLCGVSLGLAHEPIKSQVEMGRFSLHHLGIMYTTFAGYILINIVIILSIVSKEKIPPRLSTLFPLFGFGLFLITGILLSVNRTIIDRYIYNPNVFRITLLTWCIIVTFVSTVVFAIDAAFTVVNISKAKQ